MSSQIARAFTATVTPVIERQVKETISKSLVPSSAMHQELSREVRSEILGLKKEVLAWQSEALRGQEVGIPCAAPTPYDAHRRVQSIIRDLE